MDAPCEFEDINEIMLRAIEPPDHTNLSIEGTDEPRVKLALVSST